MEHVLHGQKGVTAYILSSWVMASNDKYLIWPEFMFSQNFNIDAAFTQLYCTPSK